VSASEYRPFTVVFVGEYLITYICHPAGVGGSSATPFGVAPAGIGAVGAESIIACVLAVPAALFAGASGMGTPWGGGGGGPFVGVAGAGAGGLLAMAAAS